MKQALEHIVKDAYERGWLDRDLGVSSDLSLFAKCAAAAILGEPQGARYARHIPDGSIVELDDGRLGVFCARWERHGYRMVKVSLELGVEVKASDKLIVRQYPQRLAGQLVEALAAEA